MIGGNTDIPIESIRLKLIREGLEDYEYLVLLAKRDGASAVSDLVNGLVTNVYTYDRHPDRLYSLRREIAERISK
jgi:chemotaxis methyl-accepting protein methylase